MIKPMKQYRADYANDRKRNMDEAQEQEIYMCEYVDAYVKRPLPEDAMFSLDSELGL